MKKDSSSCSYMGAEQDLLDYAPVLGVLKKRFPTYVKGAEEAQRISRRFAREVMAPLALEVDARCAEDPTYVDWDYYRKAMELHIPTSFIPEKLGGRGWSILGILAFIEEEYGRSQVVSLLHAPREAPRMEPLIWEALHGGRPAFERRYVAYVREVIGRPSSPLATWLPSQCTIWWWPARGPRVSGGCAWTDRRCRPERSIPPTAPLARPAS